MRAVILSSLFVFLGAVGACSATGGNHFTSQSSGTGGAGTGGSTGNMNLGGGFTVGTGVSVGGGQPGCSAAAELVYVLSTDNNIWSFDPPQKTFVNVMSLSDPTSGCQTPTNDGLKWAPNSMAVDRNAVAWVNYVGTLMTDQAGLIFEVDLKKKKCKSSPTVTLPSSAWFRLGMGFTADTAGSTSETLYISGTTTPGTANGPGLGKIDMSTKAVVGVGQFTGNQNDLSGQSAELTGTGDGKLFGFFTFYDPANPPPKPVHVAQIDKANGTSTASADVTLPTVPGPQAWAFSFWGGSFYLYTSPDNATPSTVTRYDPMTQMVDTQYIASIPDGFIIVGAGVSTCAPITPPN